MQSSKRNNPNFAQVSGYLSKEVAIRFKVLCTTKEVSQTDALEEAVKLWLDKHEFGKEGVA
jgi:ParG